MKQTLLRISCACLLLSGIHVQQATAQVTAADYARADSVMKRADRIYSAAIKPMWLDSSAYFWYKNQEPEGTFFYLVDGKTGKQHRAKDKKELATFFSKKQQKLADALLQEEDKSGKTWRRREGSPEPVFSPDSLWQAYVKDNNVYIKQHGVEKAEEICLTLDGSPNFRYDGWTLQWSPDSRKLATLRVRDVPERKIQLLESNPLHQRQRVLQWHDYRKPCEVIPVQFPVLFAIESLPQYALGVAPHAAQYDLRLTGWRDYSRSLTFEFH